MFSPLESDCHPSVASDATLQDLIIMCLGLAITQFSEAL